MALDHCADIPIEPVVVQMPEMRLQPQQVRNGPSRLDTWDWAKEPETKAA
jgi:hypothetical protein